MLHKRIPMANHNWLPFAWPIPHVMFIDIWLKPMLLCHAANAKNLWMLPPGVSSPPKQVPLCWSSLQSHLLSTRSLSSSGVSELRDRSLCLLLRQALLPDDPNHHTCCSIKSLTVEGHVKTLPCSLTATIAVEQWKHRVQDTVGGSNEVSHKQPRLQIPQDDPCQRKVTLFMGCLLKQQNAWSTELCLVQISPSKSAKRTWLVGFCLVRTFESQHCYPSMDTLSLAGQEPQQWWSFSN